MRYLPFKMSSPTRGTPEPIVRVNQAKGEVRVHWPWFLPDGKRFLYTVRLADGEGELRIGDLGGGSGRGGQVRRRGRHQVVIDDAAEPLEPPQLAVELERLVEGRRLQRNMAQRSQAEGVHSLSHGTPFVLYCLSLR